MSKVRICVEVNDADLSLYKAEAEREGTTVEALIEKMVQGLIREMKREEEEGTDHTIVTR